MNPLSVPTQTTAFLYISFVFPFLRSSLFVPTGNWDNKSVMARRVAGHDQAQARHIMT